MSWLVLLRTSAASGSTWHLGSSLDVYSVGTNPAGERNSHLEIVPLGGKLGEWLGIGPREAVVALASAVLLWRVISA